MCDLHGKSIRYKDGARKSRAQRINPDAFDGLCVAMQGVELAASLRVTEVLPVGGLVASAGEARLLDEGFEQDRTIRVASVPVLGQASADQGEDARGEILAVDPRQDEEAGIVDDEVQTGAGAARWSNRSDSSRGLVFQALAPKPRAATIWPAARTK